MDISKLQSKTVVELKQECQNLGLANTGKKADLIARIKSHFEEKSQGQTKNPEETDDVDVLDENVNNSANKDSSNDHQTPTKEEKPQSQTQDTASTENPPDQGPEDHQEDHPEDHQEEKSEEAQNLKPQADDILDVEKKKKRAERFNIEYQETELDRKRKRAERFGIPIAERKVTEPVKQSTVESNDASPVPRKKHQNNRNTNNHQPNHQNNKNTHQSNQNNNNHQKNKNQNKNKTQNKTLRVNSISANPIEEDDGKKKQRAERFGLPK